MSEMEPHFQIGLSAIGQGIAKIAAGIIGPFCLALLLSASPAVAQSAIPTPTATPLPTPPTDQPPAVVSIKDTPATPAPTPAAASSGNTLNWTLRDAILTALQNNVDIDIERRNVRIAEFNVGIDEGVYDTFLSATPSFSSISQPNVGRFSGVASNQNATKSDNFTVPLGLDQQIKYGGGHFTASFNGQRSSSNSGIISPLYTPQLTFNFTQPLWRNRSIDNNRLQIYVAKKTLDVTDSQFRQQVINTISQVQQAYWNLGFAIRNVSVQNQGVDLAQEQVIENQKQVEVGTLAPLEVVSAKTTLETRRQALIQAQNAVTQAENVLKQLVVEGTESPIWGKDIFPIDYYEEPASNTTLDDALTEAYANRPETEQLKTQKEIDQLNIRYFKNQTKPQIDLVSTYSLTGAGGTPTTTSVCPSGTLLGQTGLCEPGDIQPTIVPTTVNPAFIGGLGTSLSNLFSTQFHTATIGVNIALPLRNKTAKAELGRALETEQQTELQERKQLQAIEADVRNAYRSVQLAKQNLDAARLARQYAEEQFAGEQKKFSAGLSTTFLVLTRQNDLILARGSEVSSLAAYNNAVAALQLATGSTLSANNIQIQ
jgi:HAE1 family hydrophobic/amphiphilic exporter-1